MTDVLFLLKPFFVHLAAMYNKFLPFLAAVLSFGIVTFLHEFGHFIFCKLFNVTVINFSIGYGPVLLQTKLWGTMFQISALPLGGYNGAKDEVVVDSQGREVATPDSLSAKPYWQKLIIFLGGIGVNVIVGILLFSVIAFYGPAQPPLQALKIVKILENSPAQKAGLAANMQICGLQDLVFVQQPHFTYVDFSKALRENLGKTINISVNDESGNCDKAVSVTLNNLTEARRTGSVLGVELEPIVDSTKPCERPGMLQAVFLGLTTAFDYSFGVLNALKQVFVQRSIEMFGGPVMILSESLKCAQRGIIPLLFFLACLNMSLAILNLFPLGALDGGRVLVDTVESIVGRPVQALRMFTNIGTMFILLLIVVLTYKDLIRLIFG